MANTIRLSSAEKIIEKAQRFISRYRNEKKCYQKAYRDALESFPHYKKLKLFKSFRPYISGEKDLELLKNEDFLEENKQKVEKENLKNTMAEKVARSNYKNWLD